MRAKTSYLPSSWKHHNLTCSSGRYTASPPLASKVKVISKQILLIIWICVYIYTHMHIRTHMQMIKARNLFSNFVFYFPCANGEDLSIFGSSSWHIWNCKRFIHMIKKWIQIGIHIPWTPELRSPSENWQQYCMVSETSHDRSAGFISYNAREAEVFHT